MLFPEPPYPLHGGGALRSAGLLAYFARHAPVDAILFREAGAEDPRDAIPAGLVRCSLLIDLPAHSKGTGARALRNLDRARRGVPPPVDRFAGCEDQIARFCRGLRWDTAVIEHFWCAPYRPLLARHASRVVLDLHNVESVLYERCSTEHGWPVSAFYRRFARRCRAIEREQLGRFDLVLAASAADASRARAIAPGSRVEVYPNTIPSREAPRTSRRRQIIFSGNFEYDPNKAAAVWFGRMIWPLIHRRHPDLEWVLLGRNPEAVRGAVGGLPNVRLTGPVPDALPELARSLAAVVPLRSGSGTRIKILEAWSAGAPVVSTTVGVEGLPREGVLTADTPAAFAGAVERLVGSPELREDMALRAQKLFQENFTWEKGWNVLGRIGL